MNYRDASRRGIEFWRPVLEYEDRYEVSNLGNVRSLKRMLKLWYSPGGYGIVAFWSKPKQRMDSKQVHALVLTAFDGPKLNGQVCRHLDGNPANNALHNLRWGTHKENHLDAKSHGTHKAPPSLVQVGELNNAVKLTREQVDHIRQRTATAKELAALYGITQWTVFDIRKGRSWAATEVA
jgi:hypothetical protein